MTAAASDNDSQEGGLPPTAPPPGDRNSWEPLSDNAWKPLPPPPGPASKSLAKPSESDQTSKEGVGAPPPDIRPQWKPSLRDAPPTAPAHAP
eukprot:4059109-Pyramimonas_sp.AAC.1